jgi:type I site-specific restriction endonuclease
MITVGVDIPSINCIMMCRPMKSIPLFIQCVGRATRIDYNNPDDEALVIDCCEVLKRTNHHPMQRLDMNRVKTKKKAKVCQTCQEDMKIISRKAYAKDELTYINKTTYRCSNAHTLVEENMAVYNLNFCESCGVQLQAGNIEMKITTKAIEFYVKCKCGAEKVERKILLTDKELKEVQYEETMNGSDNWDKVELVLKDIAKSLGYNHRWSMHKIVAFKALEREPSEILAKIEELKAKGHKLSAIAYI